MKLRIGIDIDGILADFNNPYRKLVHEFSGVRLPEISDEYPTTWNYARDAGLDKETDDKIWEHIKSTNFWAELPAYKDTKDFLFWASWLPAEVDVYFITSRPGKTAKDQTEAWLRINGFEDAPTVLISGKKGKCAEALELTHYIDDKNENCIDTMLVGTATRMLARPWNINIQDVPRIPTLNEFKKEIDSLL